MSKLLKLILIIVLIGASLSVTYYFVIYLPSKNEREIKEKKQKEEQNFMFSMKQKCQEAGDKLYQADVSSLGETSVFVPEYTYSKSLNTCLYFGGHVEKGWINKWVKDSLTNQEIVSFMESEGNLVTGRMCPNCLSNEAFEKRKRDLFTE